MKTATLAIGVLAAALLIAGCDGATSAGPDAAFDGSRGSRTDGSGGGTSDGSGGPSDDDSGAVTPPRDGAISSDWDGSASGPPGEYEGFGGATPGGAGGMEIHVTEPSDAALRDAIDRAGAGHVIIVLDVTEPIHLTGPLPTMDGDFVTIEGGCATIYGESVSATAAMLDIRGHDVIVRNLRLRNGGDNLRAQAAGAYNIVFSHISSTGSYDDGISIGYGAHDVTVERSFLAGNTRSIFIKYTGSTNISIHHTWIMKQWIRGPLVYEAFVDLRNIIVEDWWSWGTRFDHGASGNVVSSLWSLSPFTSSGERPMKALNVYDGTPSTNVFTDDNVYAGGARETLTSPASAPFPAPPVTTLSAAEMEPMVRAEAGCLPRDAVDQAYIDLTSGWTIGDGNPLRLP